MREGTKEEDSSLLEEDSLEDEKKLPSLEIGGSLRQLPSIKPRKERHTKTFFFFMVNKFSLRAKKRKSHL